MEPVSRRERGMTLIEVLVASVIASVVAAGTESILTGGARRCYRVASQDCDGVGGAGDCLSVQVNVCWNSDFTSCPC